MHWLVEFWTTKLYLLAILIQREWIICIPSPISYMYTMNVVQILWNNYETTYLLINCTPRFTSNYSDKWPLQVYLVVLVFQQIQMFSGILWCQI